MWSTAIHRLIALVLIIAALAAVSATAVAPPAPLAPVPSPRQMAWHELGFYGFLRGSHRAWGDAALLSPQK